MDYKKEILRRLEAGESRDDIESSFTEALNAAAEEMDKKSEKEDDLKNIFTFIADFIDNYYPKLKLMSDGLRKIDVANFIKEMEEDDLSIWPW